MPNYYCECCNYNTKIKTHYKKHLETKKHTTNLKNQPKTNQKYNIWKPKETLLETENQPEETEKKPYNKPSTEINKKENKKKYSCKNCSKMFTTSQAMYRHMKYRCKISSDKDLENLVELLNQQIQNKDDDMLLIKKHNEKLQKQIVLLTKKLEIKNINSNNTLNIDTLQNNNAIQNYNFNILNHKDTNYDFLTDKDYIKCIKSCNHCVKSLIEKVHFNQTHPENMNIYVSSMKTDYLMVYKDNIWSIVDRKKHVDLLYELNEVHLENWYVECKNKYPEVIKSFNRYLCNKESSEVLNEVKKEIIRMLYNNRQLVLDSKDSHENHIICE